MFNVIFASILLGGFAIAFGWVTIDAFREREYGFSAVFFTLTLLTLLTWLVQVMIFVTA